MKLKSWMKYALAILLAVGGLIVFLMIPPDPQPTGEESLRLYQPGKFGVHKLPFDREDDTRATNANGEFPGTASRHLKGEIWLPDDTLAPAPLIVYSHGFMSNYTEGTYLAEYLAQHGYILVSVDYPLTHFQAPGGPNVRDVVHQPGDISFIIDELLSRNARADDPLFGLIDESRIAAMGLSLGGLTTELVTYHAEWRDPRLAAAISIAGPAADFTPTFFQTTDIPFMMIAGTADAIIPYAIHARPIPGKIPGSILVSLRDASHTGFAGIAATLFRWVNNPDEIGCRSLMSQLSATPSTKPMMPASAEIGIMPNPDGRPCQNAEFTRAMRPANQLMLTRLASLSFLESVFAKDEAQRGAMRDYLIHSLPEENDDVSVEVSPL